MPFKSEAQRKYLWANEPEIARDWTDTYGSGIQAAQGGRIGFRVGKGAGMEQTSDTGMPVEGSGATYSGEGQGHTGEGWQNYVPLGPIAKVTPKVEQDTFIDKFRQADINRFVKSNKKKNLNKALNYGLIDKLKGQGLSTDEIDYFDVDDIKNLYAGGANPQDLGKFRQDLEFEEKFPNPTQSEFEDYYGLNKPDTGGGGGEGAGRVPWWLNQPAPAASVDDTTTTASTSGLGSGHFQVPIEYVVGGVRAADGGLMRRRYFSGAYGQGAGDRGGDPHASAAENVAAGKAEGPSITGGDGQVAGGIFETKVLQPGLEKAKAKVDRTKAILSGAIGDPDDPSTWNFAEGGIIGSVGGTSRQKYQMGNMVGAEMEGAEMEGAIIQSKEVIKELYDALIAQGLSPQEAMEELKRMFAGMSPEEGAEEWPRSPDQGPSESPMPEFGGGPREQGPGAAPWQRGPGGRAAPWQRGPGGRPPFSREPLTPGPEAPMMGEEFPGQEFRGRPRAPAAFGGIMDTYTGRRKYGLGSFISKALKKVKKLASSKIGKLAMMYVAGTYLGGTQALSGQMGGAGTFAQRLKNPKLLANFLKPQQWGTAGTTGTTGTTALTAGNQYSPHLAAGYNKNLSTLAGKAADKNLFQKGLGFLQDHPTAAILGSSLGAGLYTAKMPIEDLDDSTSEWKRQKADMDRYLANLGSYEGGDYRVPVQYRASQGGRIGRQEGGLMNLGGMEKDYRNDGGFVPLGGEEKADDVPARLSKNEFVFTADAVRNAGGGDIDAGAEVMENVMKNLEAGGKVSEESQGQGAQEMFETSERLSEVI